VWEGGRHKKDAPCKNSRKKIKEKTFLRKREAFKKKNESGVRLKLPSQFPKNERKKKKSTWGIRKKNSGSEKGKAFLSVCREAVMSVRCNQGKVSFDDVRCWDKRAGT